MIHEIRILCFHSGNTPASKESLAIPFGWRADSGPLLYAYWDMDFVFYYVLHKIGAGSFLTAMFKPAYKPVHSQGNTRVVHARIWYLKYTPPGSLHFTTADPFIALII